MTISELCIRRPVMTTLVMGGILIFGAMAYRMLPVSDLPNVDFPTIQVNANVPGASPETMASAVATPLEKQFSTIAGVDSMNSTSTLGSTSITLQFDLSRDIDAAAQDVQAAIAKSMRQLPSEMPTPPTYQKVNPADQPVLYLALSSATLPLSDVDEYAQTMMAQRISMVSGVAQVQVYGSQKYAVRVQVDPRKLAARNVGIDEVSAAVASQNVNLPVGTLDGRYRSFNIQATGQLMKAEAYEPMIVAYRNGAPVRLSDLGKVIDSVENDKGASWYNGTRAIVLAIFRQPGTNTVEVVDSIKSLLFAFAAQLPASVKLNVLFDRSQSIRESVHDVQFTLVLAVALVILVIFLFLRNLSATIIPSLAVPLSIIGTFAAMHMLGYSIDNLSLMALTLSVGFVVDDAIVMLENIVRHMEEGEKPFEAAVKGSRQISFTILSMTLSLAAVFIPVLFMGGIIGRLLHEFAVTITVAILVSGFVSLTLTPMMCSRFLRPSAEAHHGRFYAFTEAFFDAMRAGYDRSLRFVLRHKLATVIVSIVVLVLTVHIFTITPRGFIPTDDISRVQVRTEAAQGTSFDDMMRHQKEAMGIIGKDPMVENYMSAIGGSLMNNGRMFIALKSHDERTETVDQFIQRLRPELAQIPGLRTFLVNPPAISIGGQQTKALYQLTLQGPDTDDLYGRAEDLEVRLRTLPTLQDVNSDLLTDNPQVTIDIDRDKATSLGITAEQIEVALQAAYSGKQVSTIYAPNNEYQVILELLPEHQREPSDLDLLYVRANNGTLVPLPTLAKIHQDVGPMAINHFGQLPSVTISFNLAPGVSLSEAVDKVNEVAHQTLPATISYSFQGTAKAFAASQKGMGMLLLMAIVVIYIVLGILYESYIHPVTILSGLPAAGLGALVTLLIFHQELNLYGFVGIILLVGIVKKNAIMMIDFAAEAERTHGKTAQEAIHEGCLVRFRPIMMTTMSAFVGTLPIALGFGAGAESRRSLGLAVVGGLVFSQLLTLYLTPVIYVYFEAVRKKAASWRGRSPRTAAAGAAHSPGAV